MGSISGLNKARKGLWQKGLRCIGAVITTIIEPEPETGKSKVNRQFRFTRIGLIY